MLDMSPEAVAKRAQERRGRMTVKVYRMGEEPLVDEDTLAMTPGERFEFGLRLISMCYDLAGENHVELRRPSVRLPRSAWPVHIVRR